MTLFREYAVGHSLCTKYNNKEICLEPNYWVNGDSDGTQTLSKLLNHIQIATGITSNDCSNGSYRTRCSVGNIDLNVLSDGKIQFIAYDCTIHNISEAGTISTTWEPC